MYLRGIRRLLFKFFLAYLLIQIPILVINIKKKNYTETEDVVIREIKENFIRKKKPAYSVSNLDRPALWNVQTPERTYCDGYFKTYYGYFAVLSNVTVDPHKLTGERKGGENISQVINQNEKMEFLKTQPGFFEIPCQNLSRKSFSEKSKHLQEWETSIDVNIRNFSHTFPKHSQHDYLEDTVTFAIVRGDYANLYWVFVDIFDIFFLTKVLGVNCSNVNILLVDAHPVTQLDTLWWKLFPDVTRIRHMTQRVTYKTLVWGLPPMFSPLLKKDKSEKYKLFLNEFRNFVLSQINNLENTSNVNCDNITVTIVFRKDYVAHARNPSGKIRRKIANELELVQSVSLTLKGHNVRGVQLDRLPIVEQIRLASKTDILVGMHGAGLTHVLFLPKHAGLIELFPFKYPTTSHFEFVASWRSIKYALWQNNDKRKEIDKDTTEVDTSAISSKIRNIYRQMCPFQKG